MPLADTLLFTDAKLVFSKDKQLALGLLAHFYKALLACALMYHYTVTE